MVSEALRKWMRIAGFLPVFVLASLIFILVVTGYSGFLFEPQGLALVLHFVLVFCVSLLLAFVSSRAYLKSGSTIILLIGIAAITNGVLLLVAQWGITPGLGVALTANEAVTIANVGFLLTSLFILASGIQLIIPRLNFGIVSSRKLVLWAFYGGAILLIAMVIFSSISGFFPLFFSSSGPTALRQAVLGIAAFIAVISCVMYGIAYLRTRSPILYWYTLGLISFVISLLGTAYTIKIGDPINWCGRVGLYLTGFFFIMAVMAPGSGQGFEASVSNRWAYAFRNDRKRLASLFANMRNGVLYGKLVMDDNGKPIDLVYLDMNDAYEAILESKKENFLGKRVTEALPSLFDRLPNWLGPYVQAAIKGETVHYERSWPYSGKWYYITIYSPEKGYFVAINEDITERRKAQEELAESQQKEKARREELEAIMDAVPATIWISHDAAGTDMIGNKAVQELLGLPPEANVSESAPHHQRPQHFLAYRDDNLIPTEELPMQMAGRTGRPVLGTEFEFRFDDGRSVWVYGNVVPLKNEDGSTRGAIGAFVDISERKNAEEELKRSNAELQQFAYLASHDLQEPLRMVLGYLSLLERKYKGELDTQAKEYINHAVDGGTRMRRLIDDLLAYSRVEASAKSSAPVDMKEIVEDTIKVLKTSIDESKADVYIEPLPTVMADGLQMQLVMQNLISNAIKFHGTKRPMVHISAKEGAKEWTFSVKDNGIGLNVEYADKIFQMFQRLHTTEQYPGTGVGLAIVKKIIDRHGGRIWVESEEGKGATFFFTIPKSGGGRVSFNPNPDLAIVWEPDRC